MKAVLTRFWSNYGMAGVLLLLCLYYSFATLQEQRPQGAVAAKSLAASLQLAAHANILIWGKTTDDDAQFADELERRLKAAGYEVSQKVLGDPRAARVTIEELT